MSNETIDNELDGLLKRIEKDRNERVQTARGEVSKVIEDLKARGVTSVRIEYEGSGDSGSVNSVTAFQDDKEIPDLFVGPHQSGLEDFAYAFLESEHDGWEINEGSSGVITIDTATLKARMEHSMNVVSTEESTSELDL